MSSFRVEWPSLSLSPLQSLPTDPVSVFRHSALDTDLRRSLSGDAALVASTNDNASTAAAATAATSIVVARREPPAPALASTSCDAQIASAERRLRSRTRHDWPRGSAATSTTAGMVQRAHARRLGLHAATTEWWRATSTSHARSSCCIAGTGSRVSDAAPALLIGADADESA